MYVTAVEQFREEIEPHCSDYLMERYVNIFKRSVPSAQRFIERKFEMILEEQDRELREKESEVNRLDSDNTRMSMELSQLRSFTSCCVDTADRLSCELDKRRTLSRLVFASYLQFKWESCFSTHYLFCKIIMP